MDDLERALSRSENPRIRLVENRPNRALYPPSGPNGISPQISEYPSRMRLVSLAHIRSNFSLLMTFDLWPPPSNFPNHTCNKNLAVSLVSRTHPTTLNAICDFENRSLTFHDKSRFSSMMNFQCRVYGLPNSEKFSKFNEKLWNLI